MGEWNETVIDSNRGYRGGDFAAGGGAMGAHLRRSADPTERVYNRGFRVATVPEPDGWLLGMTALLALAGLRRNS